MSDITARLEFLLPSCLSPGGCWSLSECMDDFFYFCVRTSKNPSFKLTNLFYSLFIQTISDPFSSVTTQSCSFFFYNNYFSNVCCISLPNGFSISIFLFISFWLCFCLYFESLFQPFLSLSLVFSLSPFLSVKSWKGTSSLCPKAQQLLVTSGVTAITKNCLCTHTVQVCTNSTHDTKHKTQ